MVEMSVAGLGLDASNRSPILLLRDPSGRRQVPIWIDHAQAHNIMSGLQKDHSQRPLSHDLMINLLEAGNLSLERVIIHNIEDSTFQAVLKLSQIVNGTAQKDLSQTIEINARPSDAIALAIRTECSIWMLEEVVSEASIPVDADADAEDQDEFHQFIEKISPSELVQHLKTRDSSEENLID